MNKEDKNLAIQELTEELSAANIFYLADTSGLDAETTSNLRRKCFGSDVKLKVVKNTLLEKAMEKVEGQDYSEMYAVLKGATSIMYSEVGNAPAKVIKEFRKKSDKPILKAAFIEEAIFIGDDNLKALSEIKSKDELIGEIVGLLQSPAKNVISGLKGQGGKISGILKTLSERA